MSLSNLQELDQTINQLVCVLLEHNSPSYTLGYMQVTLKNIIQAYVPAKDHAVVIDILNQHMEELKMKIQTYDLYIYPSFLGKKKVYHSISRVAVKRFVEYYDTPDYIIIIKDMNNGQG